MMLEKKHLSLIAHLKPKQIEAKKYDLRNDDRQLKKSSTSITVFDDFEKKNISNL